MRTAKRIMFILSITASAVLPAVCGWPLPQAAAMWQAAVESTWTAASNQIKSVVNKVVFPAIDMILAIFFFVKLGTGYLTIGKLDNLNGRLRYPVCLSGLYADGARCISGGSSGYNGTSQYPSCIIAV